MDKILTFCDYLDLFILPYTKYGDLKAMNQIFYGSISSTQISRTMASRYKKNGIGGKSNVFADYIESQKDLTIKAKYIEGLNLSGLPTDVSQLLKMLEGYQFPANIRNLILHDNSIYIALLKILHYVITMPSYSSDLLISESFQTVEINSTVINMENFLENLLSESINDIHIDIAFHGGIDFFQERRIIKKNSWSMLKK